MRRIILLAQNLVVDSKLIQYTAQIAKASRAEVVCFSLLTSYSSTAELIHAQQEDTGDQLQKLRARQTTADWIRTLEDLRARQWAQAEQQKKELKDYFESRQIRFACKLLTFDSTSLLRALEDVRPFDLVIASRLRFPRDLAAQGFMTIADLGARFSCPAIDVEIMEHFLRPPPRSSVFQFVAYGGGTLVACALFWLHIDELGPFLMSGRIAAALANLAAAALMAFGYGKTIHCLLRVGKLDIY